MNLVDSILVSLCCGGAEEQVLYRKHIARQLRCVAQIVVIIMDAAQPVSWVDPCFANEVALSGFAAIRKARAINCSWDL